MGMRILLVDDELEGRSFLANYLRLLGHTVRECVSGEEALAAYQAGVYDMILSDIKMSGISGIELVRKVKQIKREQEADVVLYFPQRLQTRRIGLPPAAETVCDPKSPNGKTLVKLASFQKPCGVWSGRRSNITPTGLCLY